MRALLLPDEIIKEILSPALRVPDEAFRSNAAISPFSTYGESTSHLLVVCKSWLRVATPLLYHVVIVRSKGQAKALSSALKGNKLLATFIKKLRVEGGYGQPMHHVLRLSENIEELYLNLSIWSADSVAGLCKGLPLVNPRCLFLNTTDSLYTTNAPTRTLIKALCESIKKWNKLSELDLPFRYSPASPNVINDICDAFQGSQLLKVITLKEPQYDRVFLTGLAKIPSLEVIHVKRGPTPQYLGAHRGARAAIEADPVLSKLVHFDFPIDQDDDYMFNDTPTEPEPNITVADQTANIPTFDSSFVALQSVAHDVKVKIWSNIIHFSLLTTKTAKQKQGFTSGSISTIEESKDLVYPSPSRDLLIQPHKTLPTNVILVSKQFYNLAMRQYCRHLFVNGVLDLDRMSTQISRLPNTSTSIIHSVITKYCYGGRVANLRPIISSATNLVHLISRGTDDKTVMMLDYKCLTTLASNVGSKLQTLLGQFITRPNDLRPATPLYAFTALRELDWNSGLQLDFKPEKVPRDALSRLEILSVVSTNDSFLRLLKCMDLPALRSVAFPVAKKMEGALDFLATHGEKLLILDVANVHGCWEACPSLKLMLISARPIFEPHENVEKIIFTNPQ
ncbi:hypothetical protein H0H93_014800 [Arthromyces matolae]|nr:hypothetical protein H0H93_014800 [Arthromyces matolae]